MAQRQFNKDFEAAEKDHGKFLEAEALQEALKPKPIPFSIRFEHTHILGPPDHHKREYAHAVDDALAGENDRRPRLEDVSV